MAVFSKPLRIYCTCYELGHCWTPSCVQASTDVAKNVFSEALKIYGALYLVTALLRRKGWRYYVKKFVPETLQSSLFLTVNGTSFITFFCVWRRLIGSYNFYDTFVCGVPACAACLFIEQRDRRGPLAIYLTNLAVETAFRMAVTRGLVRPIRNGEVLLFSLASAVYLYLFRKKDGLPKSTLSVFRFLVGSAENPDSTSKDCNANNATSTSTTTHTSTLPSSTTSTTTPTTASSLPSTSSAHPSEKSRKSAGSSSGHSVLKMLMTIPGCQKLMGVLRTYWSLVDRRLKASPRHGCCPHDHGCLHYVLQGLCRMFGLGFVVQVSIKVLSSLSTLRRSPRELTNILREPGTWGMAAFLGLYSGVFRGVNCSLRWVRQKDSALHGIVGGFLAGGAMYFYQSSTVALFCASKLVEALYFKGIEAGRLPYIPHAEVVIYAFSCAFVFHAAVMEPHALRPTYWKWLLRVTHNKFAYMNRHLLEVFGTNASKMFPGYWPDYDPKFSSLARPPS